MRMVTDLFGGGVGPSGDHALNPVLVAALRRASRAGGLILVALGLSVLAGWAFDSALLRGFGSSLVSMKVNTALLFVVLGVGLSTRRDDRPARDWLFGGIVAGVASLTAAQTLLGADLGIDEMFVGDPTSMGVPGRMSPAFEVGFFCLGVSLPLGNTRLRWFADVLCGTSGGVAFFAVCGYLYDVGAMHHIGAFAPVALNAALGMAVASVSVLAARPDAGAAALVASSTTAGAAARRLLPAIVVLPLALGWVTVNAERLLWLDTSMGNAVDGLGGMLLLATLTLATLSTLNREEVARRAAVEALGRRERRARLLSSASREFALAGQDLDVLLGHLADTLSGTLGEVVLAAIVDPSARELATSEHVVRGANTAVQIEALALLEAAGIRLGEGITGRVAASGRAVLVPVADARQIAAGAPEHLRDLILRLSPKSLLSVPMQARGRVLGVVTLLRLDSKQPYTAEDLELASEIADRAAIVVHNALLLRDLEARVSELARAEGKFRGLLEMAPDALLLVDQAGQIQMINARTEVMFGYSEGELVGRPVEILVPSLHRTGHAAQRQGYDWGATRGCPMAAGRDVDAVRRDGTVFPVEINLGPIVTEQGPCIAASVRDLTERRRLEAASRQAFEFEEGRRRAEEGSRLKSELLANMSHELRTPLNAILGFTGLVVSGKAGPISERQEEYLGDVLENGRHLLQLINDILDHSKIEAGRMELEIADVDVGRFARELMTTAGGLALGRGIELRLELADPAPVVRTDWLKLKQIAYNLVSNAIKFTPPGGVVTLGIEPFGSGGIAIRVSDTGIGIAATDLDRLFVPFQQLDSNYARTFGGTGLGLALTRRLAEALGGRVQVVSERGHGSTFTVTLPPQRPSLPPLVMVKCV